MKRLMLCSVVLFAAVVAGCSSAPPARSNYDAYSELVTAQQAGEAKLIASIAGAANACTDSRCVEHVAALAALASARGSGSGNSIAPPPREPSGTEKLAAVLGALSPVLGTAINGAVSWHQSDNAVKQSEAQYGYLGSVIGSALTGMRDVAVGATPSINVGGNYGDTFGDDYTGGDRTQTEVAGHLISGDGTVIGDRNGNSGRQDSPGPYEPAEPAEPDAGGG